MGHCHLIYDCYLNTLIILPLLLATVSRNYVEGRSKSENIDIIFNKSTLNEWKGGKN